MLHLSVVFCFVFLGFIGKIQLQVPIRRLKSEHWIITLDKLVLVAGPLTDTEVMYLIIVIWQYSFIMFAGE